MQRPTRSRRRRARAKLSDAADGRDRGPHRPREDVARASPDRKGHRPPARGATARHLDRARLRAAPASGRAAAVRRRRSRPRAFRQTMVAGATGIDPFLLVIDAGEGARPQTREHLAICACWGSSAAWSRSRRSTRSTRNSRPRVEEARGARPGAEVVRVSARTGEGIDELRSRSTASPTRSTRARDGPTRLYVDRVFCSAGFGTVVTGRSGRAGRRGRPLRLEPPGDVRVRSVQVHDRDVERAGRASASR